MDLSIFLAKVIGLYFVILTTAMWVNKKYLRDIIADFLASRPLWIFSSIVILILGLLLTVSHNVWIADWPLLITLIGWFFLINGVGRLVFQEHFKRTIYKIFNSSAYQTFSGVFFVIGLFLTYKGFV